MKDLSSRMIVLTAWERDWIAGAAKHALHHSSIVPARKNEAELIYDLYRKMMGDPPPLVVASRADDTNGTDPDRLPEHR
jgi:hypothetical protein